MIKNLEYLSKNFDFYQDDIWSIDAANELLFDIINFEEKNVTTRKNYTIGCSIYEHINDIESYFYKKKTKDFDSLFPTRKVLVKEILERFNCKIAYEKKYGEYYTGLIRILRSPLYLHTDFAARQLSSTLIISNCIEQFAINIYLSKSAKEEGECVVYQKMNEAEDSKYKLEAPFSYGYEDELVLNRSSFKIEPKQYSFSIFNSRYYHKVKSSSLRRVTLSFFVGITNSGKIITWT